MFLVACYSSLSIDMIAMMTVAIILPMTYAQNMSTNVIIAPSVELWVPLK